MKGGRRAPRMPPAKTVRQFQVLPEARFRQLYGDAEADAYIAQANEMIPPKPGDNRARNLGVPVTPVAPLTKEQKAEIVAAVPELDGKVIDWDTVHAARHKAAVENERVTKGVRYSDFKPYLKDVEKHAAGLLRLLTKRAPELIGTLRRCGAGVAGLIEPLQDFAANVKEMQATNAKVYAAPATLGVIVLVQGLAPVFEASGLKPTSGRAANQSPFAKFVAAVLATTPIEYDTEGLEFPNRIDDALRG